ncbi:MAG: endospore germination permease [Clostridiaceae bacterium]|nr:endospore germination permease [Clostridiaceae bacterium]
MIKDGKFGYHEAISIFVITIFIKVFFTSPTMVAKIVGTSGWLMTLISALSTAFFFTFQYLLLKRFPNMSQMEINDTVLGNKLGRLLTFFFSAYILIVAGIDMREFIEVMKVFVLPDSPPSFIMIIFCACIVALCATGLETIARFAKFIVYIVIGGYILVILLSIPNFRLYRLFPLFGYGLDKTLITGFLRSSYYGEIALVGAFAKSLQGSREIKRIGYTSIFLTGILTSSACLFFNLAFSYITAQEQVSPMYTLATMVNLGTFLQRVDPIFLFLWNFGTFIEVSVFFYASMVMFCHVFEISDRRPVLLPMTTILFCINLIPKGLNEVSTELVQSLRTWGWVFYFLPSVLVLIIAVLRKKKGELNNA